MANDIFVHLFFVCQGCQLNFQPIAYYFTGRGPKSIVVIDLNNDNHSDLVISHSNLHDVGVLLGNGYGTFAEQILSSSGNMSMPGSIVVRDFSRDGRMDVAMTDSGMNSITVLFGNNDGTFQAPMMYSIGRLSSPASIVAADFNSDGYLDLAVIDYFPNNIVVFLGNDDGTFGAQTTFSNRFCPASLLLSVGYFNSDSHVDFVVASWSQKVCVLLGDGRGHFNGTISFRLQSSSNPSSLIVADFNNDNQLDLVTANSGIDNVGVMLSDGGGTFRAQTIYSTGADSRPSSVAMGDFNNDGYLDIAISNSHVRNIGVLLGMGNGTFQTQITFQ